MKIDKYLKKRIASGVIDIILFNITMFILFRIAGEEFPEFFFIAVTCILFVFKDYSKGRSHSKRIMDLHIIDLKNNKAATKRKCIIRNIPAIIYFLQPLIILIEIPFFIINPQRRIGDLLAGTIIKQEGEDNYIHDRRNMINLFITGLIIFAVIAIGFIIYYIYTFEYHI